MSRLSGRTIQEIQHEIADTALKCAAETGSVCVLKDACTVIADEKGQMYLNLSGNSGMATAGSGDVLFRDPGSSVMYVSENGGTASHGFKGRVRCLSSRTLR